jgi:hypothetical protein
MTESFACWCHSSGHTKTQTGLEREDISVSLGRSHIKAEHIDTIKSKSQLKYFPNFQSNFQGRKDGTFGRESICALCMCVCVCVCVCGGGIIITRIWKIELEGKIILKEKTVKWLEF